MFKTPYRPKLDIPKTTGEIIADIIGIGALLLAILFIALNWSSLPAEIPAHFNGAGDVDRWGSKFEILILPAISIGLFAMMYVLEKKPHVHNYPDRLNETNVEAFYTTSRKMLNIMKNLINILFAYCIYETILVAQEKADALNMFGMMVFLVPIFAVIIIGMIKMMRIK
ncbi:DUF1648 domain-containing protein [Solibacillus sp. CAU 1738]|uniref:DUF1648 domain-containing protein n=1 Tax=Solibacillus sp. CAU 1738 TaxID=3140363 RepID=UPI003260BF15